MSVTSLVHRLRQVPPFPVVPLLVILAVGLTLRLVGLHWDGGGHLHPDERYVTVVAEHVAWPGSVGEYFDVDSSPLSPYNTDSGTGYLYGQLPLLVTKAVSTALGQDTYDGIYIVGRALSAIVDTLSILLVFLVARIVAGNWTDRARDLAALLAAAFYALAVTAIQHAHFFTMESWLVATTLLTFWLAARLGRLSAERLPLASLAAVGAAVGLTAATKLSGLLVVGAVAVALAALAWRSGTTHGQRLGSLVGASLLVAVCGYVAFRLVSPYAFEHSNWLDIRPNSDFRDALDAQRSAINGEFLYPPAYQWLLSTPWLDPLRNEVVWGLGIPLGVAALAGLAAIGVRVVRERRALLLEQPATARLMLLVVVALVYWQFASRFAHAIRYLLPLVPFACVAAAYAVGLCRSRGRAVFAAAAAVVCLGTLAYALAFVSIYRSPNTRTAATAWLDAETPIGANLVSEHWDDALPVRPIPGRYERSELPVFDPDDDAKLRKLYDGLANADYYVLSSPRAWHTIGRLPDRFPIMARFYQELFGGSLGFTRAARFESPPRLPGVKVSDLGAEEPFWVYDHPIVLIYRHSDHLDWETFRRAVCDGEQLPGCS